MGLYKNKKECVPEVFLTPGTSSCKSVTEAVDRHDLTRTYFFIQDFLRGFL